jgi:hypothetical protein
MKAFYAALTSLVAIALLLEITLAVVPINTKSVDRFDFQKGFGTYIPGAYYRQTKEGAPPSFHFNSHGYHDYERTYEKPSNTYRIIVLGDSQVESLQVSLEKTFTAQLEKALNSGQQRVEVLALGHSGLGTAEEYLLYLNEGVKYQPDLVILLVTTSNDMQNNSRFLSYDSMRIYFQFDDNGELVMDRSLVEAYKRSQTWPKVAFQRLKEHSYLASLVSQRWYLLREMQHRSSVEMATAPGLDTAHATAPGLSELSWMNIYTDLSPHWREAFAVTEALILKLRREVEAHGSRFLLVTSSNGEQVHPELADRYRRKYGMTFDYERPNRFFDAFAKRHSVPLLQLMPIFRDHYRKHGEYLHGFAGSMEGHWNEAGHRLAAESLSSFLTANSLIDRDTRGHD